MACKALLTDKMRVRDARQSRKWVKCTSRSGDDSSGPRCLPSTRCWLSGAHNKGKHLKIVDARLASPNTSAMCLVFLSFIRLTSKYFSHYAAPPFEKCSAQTHTAAAKPCRRKLTFSFFFSREPEPRLYSRIACPTIYTKLYALRTARSLLKISQSTIVPVVFVEKKNV